MSIENFEDAKWQAFVNKCKNQVEKDKKILCDENIAYYPSGEVCHKPEYCLIAMEPSLGKSKISDIEKKVEKGCRIFFLPIVSYCAWRYLCGGKYNFHITDFDKGVKSVKLAGDTQNERWGNWLPLLEKELDLLGNPKTISLGKDLYGWMCENGLEVNYSVYFYAGKALIYIKRKYEHLKKEFPKEMSEPLPTIKELKEYETYTLKKFGDPRFFTDEQIEKTTKKDLGNDLTEEQKILLAYYRHEFTRIRKRS